MANVDNILPKLSGMGRFTQNARQTIIRAHSVAQKYKSPEVMPIHVFLAMLETPSELIRRILEYAGLDVQNTRQAIILEVKKLASSHARTIILSAELKKIINDSFIKAEQLSHVYVGMEHLLLAMLDLKSEQFVKELIQHGLNEANVKKILADWGSYLPGILSETSPSELEQLGETSSLPFFSRDMNALAKSGSYLSITGRDEEIQRLIHILSRKTKNNPILVGDAGVGKTAVVEGFVQRILREDVPPSFIGKQIVSLDVAAIIAGARIRGDVEERILNLVNDAVESGDKIVFIDEIHMIVGAGSQGSRDSMDIGNILKPYLVDPKLRIIGATTVAEYRKCFDDDPALSRRFQPIDIDEIDKESAIAILKHLRKDFETYHGVKIKDDALDEAVQLSSKFITDRFLPDKAIDLIDEAAASVKIGMEVKIEPQLAKLGEELISIRHRKQSSIERSELAEASRLKKKESEITFEIEELVEGKKKIGDQARQVTPQLLRNIVVNWTKIPLAAASIDDGKLKNLHKAFRSKIVGQDHVLENVVQALKRSHLGLTDEKRPLASFLFLGPTGVGKTELAKTIASELFGSQELLFQFNMSEFMEQHSVAKLIGSPPGYVGYQEGGQLTESVRRKPYSVILFDEVEKAHPEVLNLLLQILEEGELKDGRGRKAMFKNTVVILTSNIGADQVSKDKKLGFNVSVNTVQEDELGQAFEDMRDKILSNLQDEVRPEILNRLDDVIVFRGLNKEDSLEITQILVDQLVLRFLENRLSLEVSPGVIQFINNEGYSQEYGARNIRRKIQEVIENGLAEYLIEKKVRKPRKGLLRIKARTKGKAVEFSKAR